MPTLDGKIKPHSFQIPPSLSRCSAWARTAAFPGISTGLHVFPVERAATIALREVSEFIGGCDLPDSVVFVCFDASSMDIYTRLLDELKGAPAEG
ncbi:MAG TPA: hypothetical protein QGF35_04500 [Dehalococcoidia bacterium]|nr:hypothetical protein [Dehalococcoidia bacterium]